MAKSTLYTLIGAFILLSVTLINGQPFFNSDTSNYIRAPDAAITTFFGSKHATSWTRTTTDDSRQKFRSTNALHEGFVISGRSPFYGGILYLGEITGDLILSTVIQALILSYALFILIVRCLEMSPRIFLLSVVGLTLLSTASYYVALLMPDIFAGIAILIAGILLAFWEKIDRTERVALGALLAFAILTHASIELVIIVILGTVVSAGRIFGHRAFLVDKTAPIAVIFCCIIAGILGEVAFNATVSSALGHPPVRPPFLTARLIDLGPGYEYVRSDCRDDQFVVCKFRERLPQPTDTFIWSQSPKEGVFSIVDTDTKRKLGEEQYRFALSVFKFDPAGVIAGYLHGGLTQLFTFGLEEFRYCEICDYEGKLPHKYWSKISDAIAFKYHRLVDFSEWTQFIVVILSVLYLAFIVATWLVRGGSPVSPLSRVGVFFSVLVVGILANAFICGAFSTIHDRYQARVIWLIPLMALLAFAIQRMHARAIVERSGNVAPRVSELN